MKNEGWTLSDLAGELWARGIDINDVPDLEIGEALDCPTPDRAADKLYEHTHQTKREGL